MKTIRRLDIHRQEGAVIVEFAVLFLLLVVLVFGVVEFGFLWMQSQYINNAAREGARAAAKLKADELPGPVVENAVREMLRGVYGDTLVADCCSSGDFIAIDVADVTVGGLSSYEVTVEVQTAEIWDPLLWGLLNLFHNDPANDHDNHEDVVSLQGSALFVRQNQPPP
ncbi:MAG: hypothetical protein C0624_07320 [Desulfuromonas sp.]|nr:MAG: hypothetical protein C0624_07320 [Desulfuromonas sp.]